MPLIKMLVDHGADADMNGGEIVKDESDEA